MKTNILLILVVMVTSIYCGCTGESPVTPQSINTLQSGVTTNLNGVFFEDALKGYVVGDSGIVLTTTNGGSTWNKTEAPTNKALNCYGVSQGLHYLGAKEYIAKGTSPTSLHGVSIKGLVILSSFAFPSNKTFAFGGNSAMNSIWGLCVVWNNSTDSWQYVDYQFTGGILGKPTKINDTTLLVPSRTVGVLGSATPRIYRLNVTTLGVDTTYLTRSLYALSSGGNSSTVVGVGENNITYSTNSGASWTRVSTPNLEWLYDVAMISATEGYACGEGGALLKTTDGGASWSSVSSGTTKNLRSIFFPNASVGYVVGEAGTIIKITPEDS